MSTTAASVLGSQADHAVPRADALVLQRGRHRGNLGTDLRPRAHPTSVALVDRDQHGFVVAGTVAVDDQLRDVQAGIGKPPRRAHLGGGLQHTFAHADPGQEIRHAVRQKVSRSATENACSSTESAKDLRSRSLANNRNRSMPLEWTRLGGGTHSGSVM